VQVTALHEPPWTLLDVGELQLKLQLAQRSAQFVRCHNCS
jgi:hypothetical protein